MITKIEVNGFKSLVDFKLKLKSGVNILVGPNGAGKTNIILFFEFLSHLINNQVGNAVSQLGGAGSIFKKIGNEDYQDFIEAKIYGANRITSKQFLVYEYEFQINTSFEKDNLFFSRQNIRIRTASKFWDDPDSKLYENEWDVDLSFKSDGDSKNEVEIINLDSKKISHRLVYGEKLSDKKIEAAIKSYLKGYNLSYYSIVHSLFRITEFARFIRIDLKGGETFNIIPSKVKELEDSAAPPEIKKDGSGLSTTLYAMKKGKPRVERRVNQLYLFSEDQRMSFNPKTLERIISFLRLANSTIKHLNVENDPFSNKLVIKISISSGGYDAVLPLSSMSDGTIKWLTLITAILTSKTIFSIEEPENFLHPWMQAEIVNIMREHLSEKKLYSFVLMTTHSESLLNYAKPEELIIVNLENGRTIANRISNVKSVKKEISATGFGLGHFYFSNSLTNE
ncbi:MAG: AAA family ATPase [Chitinophagaceae bacterium]